MGARRVNLAVALRMRSFRHHLINHLLPQHLKQTPPPTPHRKAHKPRTQRILTRHPRSPEQPQQPPNPPPVTRIGLPPIQPIVNRRPRNPQNPRKLRLVDRQRRLKLPHLSRDRQRADGPSLHPEPPDLPPINPRAGHNPRKHQKRNPRVPPVQRLDQERTRRVPIPPTDTPPDPTPPPDAAGHIPARPVVISTPQSRLR